ncbi:MAG: putative lipid II flippase FtsW [Desulfovibrio sp.]|jgi:cell division protein FtsW|nr:putative lipid II flippase FtsW [Desulfovibrio sp.]
MKNFFVAKQSVNKGTSGLNKTLARETGRFDWWLFTITLVILGLGLVMVLSASGIRAEEYTNDKYYFFERQLLFAGLGGLALWGAALIPREWLYKLQYPALFTALLLMLITLSPLAPAVNGAKRWIPLGPVSLQPMEFLKIAMVLYLAYFMSAKQELIKTFSRGVIPPFAVTGLFCFLLLLQPDFGSAVILAGLLFFMCIAGGTRFIYIFFSFALACVGALALAIASPYRLRRLLAFLDPFQDFQNTGYQLGQSLLAIGSGSFFGLGVGASKQKMYFLPETHTDFIMAVLAEEMGFVGMSLVMTLFALLFWRCYRIVMGQAELRDRFTAFGLTTILGIGAAVNLAVVMGMAPPKGVPMPLISYGGSSLIATMICIGLLMNYSRTSSQCFNPQSAPSAN